MKICQTNHLKWPIQPAPEIPAPPTAFNSIRQKPEASSNSVKQQSPGKPKFSHSRSYYPDYYVELKSPKK